MKKVLVVDDSLMNRKLASKVLGDSYEVLLAESGQQTLLLLQREKVDLILLDIVMPEMDGFETLERIRGMAKTADVPVIFLTASSDDDTRERALALGVADLVEKPFRKDELLDKVRNCISV